GAGSSSRWKSTGGRRVSRRRLPRPRQRTFSHDRTLPDVVARALAQHERWIGRPVAVENRDIAASAHDADLAMHLERRRLVDTDREDARMRLDHAPHGGLEFELCVMR